MRFSETLVGCTDDALMHVPVWTALRGCEEKQTGFVVVVVVDEGERCWWLVVAEARFRV